MKLFYNPSFSGNAYVDFKKTTVLLDSKIVNTAGLCGIIKLHAGICSEVKDYGTRFVDYYAAMKKYMKKNPYNVMAASFNVDKLNTAKKCLEWRDTLTASGWTGSVSAPTERMKVLCGVEEFFHDKSAGEELLDIIIWIEEGCPLPELEIITSSYYEDFAPSEVRLLKALIERGVLFSTIEDEDACNNISKIHSVLEGKKGVVLDPKDDSFEIWNFEEKDEAVKYLTMHDADEFDVWINADNKEFDNWQKLEGKKLSGSEISGIPQIAELLTIGLTIFERPLNVYNIVEWLNTTLNPLSDFFRKKLAETICGTGGYYNDACRTLINEQIEKYPDSKERIEKFLPDINTPYFEESDIEVDAIKEFVKNLRSWCSQKIAMNKDCDAQIDQLGYVINQANTLLLLLEEYGETAIPYSDIELMTSVISTDVTLMQYSAQSGCKNIINSYADFCDAADKTIWCDFYQNGNAGKLTYSFLSPVEIEKLREELPLWETAKEQEYIRKLILTPFAKTKKKLVLVTIDKIGSSPAPKSPLYIQLEKYFADTLSPFVHQKKLDDSHYRLQEKIDNRMESDQEFVEIKNTEFIKKNWPDHQSYSSLENLIPHPLDYVISSYAKFTTNDVNAIKDFSTITGSVAHKIIEILFSPKDEVKDSGTPAYIRKQIDLHFDEVFAETVQSEGAILLVKENRLELQKFKKQVKTNLEELLKGIEGNDLHVLACEKRIGYSKDTDKDVVLSHGIIGNLDITGNVDMLLEDSEGNPYIFDFKWTSSSKRHASMLEDNKSVQLALYKELVSKEMKKEVKAVAYFLMPAARFVSCQELKGAINFQQVRINPDRKTKDLLKEIQKSYDYRMKEVLSGKLEETTGWTQDAITYEKKREELGLMPMDYYDDMKSGPYDDIGLIKGRK
ncbi:MAG: PD-(D/E)XK nuclease family protein [Treponema sp.]|nr:PD-(D/E)XK nuclease family protein [Treponema sp.]